MIIDAPTCTHIPALRRLWKQAFGDTDAFLDDFFQTAFSPQRCRCVFIEEQPAAVLYWFDCRWEEKPLAYLYAVATDTAFQGKGLCRKLMEDTLAHLKALGYAGSILVPCSTSLFNMYEKMGYTTCCCVQEFSCQAGTAIPIQRLNAEQYAQQRQQYLPTGGVLQEDHALALLQTQGIFYGGEDFLAVCVVNGKDLVVSELLGDLSAAPGIVAALGCSSGKIRAPGNERPFAMYHSLTHNTDSPSYFGLALD